TGIRHGLRLHGRLAASDGALRISRFAGTRERAAAHDSIQRQSGRQLRFCNRDGIIPEWQGAGEDSIRQRVVVPGSKRWNRATAQRVIEYRFAVAICRHGYPLAIVYVISSA